MNDIILDRARSMDDDTRDYFNKHMVRIKKLELTNGKTLTNCYIDPLAVEIRGFVPVRQYKAVEVPGKEELNYINISAIASITVDPEDHKKLYSALLTTT